jgi:hypothetical protein
MCPTLTFCSPRLIIDGPGDAVSNFTFCNPKHIFGCQMSCVLFLIITLTYSFFMVPRVLRLIFMFCASEIVFGGPDVDESDFHILHSQTSFRRSLRCWVQFSLFVLPNSFSTFFGMMITRPSRCQSPHKMCNFGFEFAEFTSSYFSILTSMLSHPSALNLTLYV